MQKVKGSNRVAIIGCRHIGAGNAYSLLQSGAINELVLIDEDSKQLLGEIEDLRQTIPLDKEFQIRSGNYSDAAAADIVIIAAGKDRLSDETRLDVLNKNARLIREIMRQLKAENFAGIVLITTNPADILTQIAWEESGLPAEKIIGSGAILNTAQLDAILGKEISGKEYATVEAADAQTATWCAARTGGNPLVDFCNPICPDFGDMLERIRSANTAPSQIVGRKSYTPFAVGSCVNKICEAILRDERALLPVSALTNGQYGISGVYLNLQCIVGKNGISQIVEMPISDAELAELKTSAELLKEIISKLKSQGILTAKNHL